MRIKLIPKTKEEMKHFLTLTIEDYAYGVSKVHDVDMTVAKEMSEKEINGIFETTTVPREQKLISVIEEVTREEIGGVWYGKNVEQNSAFIFQIMIYEKYRGKGYGKIALEQFHILCKEEEKITTISLSVFEWNKIASGLYEKSGYKRVATRMKKRLDE